MQVKEPFNLTSQLAAIPLRREAVSPGSQCKVYGWGDIIEVAQVRLDQVR